jgi:hypothetical protein
MLSINQTSHVNYRFIHGFESSVMKGKFLNLSSLMASVTELIETWNIDHLKKPFVVIKLVEYDPAWREKKDAGLYDKDDKIKEWNEGNKVKIDIDVKETRPITQKEYKDIMKSKVIKKEDFIIPSAKTQSRRIISSDKITNFDSLRRELEIKQPHLDIMGVISDAKFNIKEVDESMKFMKEELDRLRIELSFLKNKEKDDDIKSQQSDISDLSIVSSLVEPLFVDIKSLRSQIRKDIEILNIKRRKTVTSKPLSQAEISNAIRNVERFERKEQSRIDDAIYHGVKTYNDLENYRYDDVESGSMRDSAEDDDIDSDDDD